MEVSCSTDLPPDRREKNIRFCADFDDAAYCHTLGRNAETLACSPLGARTTSVELASPSSSKAASGEMLR